MATQFDKRVLATLATTVALLMASSVHAAITISSEPTENMSCSAGICVPTASDAVLNVSDLTTMLAAGSLTVQSDSQAQDILIEAPFSWTSSNALTLDAYRGLTVDKPVADAGPAALNIATNDGGAGGYITFRYKGRIHFTGTKNALTINGQGYKLVKDVASLASAVAKNSSGFYALADNYDAAKDGTYSDSPIRYQVQGIVQGLGNAISNLTLVETARKAFFVGFFKYVGLGSIQSFTLHNINYTISQGRDVVGGLVGESAGVLYGNHIDGTIQSKNGAGGLAGSATNAIIRSSASVTISSKKNSGGLVIDELGEITESFSDGSSIHGNGGLITYSDGAYILNNYSNGPVKGGPAGGFVGSATNYTYISSSYSTGRVGGKGPVGGFAGEVDQESSGYISNAYWDKKTSGDYNGVGQGSDAGITGLTTKQFKSGLPAGFDPSVWAQDPNINNGYPYLIMNPPPK